MWAGTPLKRLNSRVRTLDDGCLPVINYGSLVDGIEYRVKTFAAPVGLDPHANLLGFVRITATNPGKTPRRAAVGARVFDHEGSWRHPFFDHTKPLWWTDRFIDQATWQPWKLWEPTEVRDGGEVHRTDSKHLVFHYRPDQSGWKVFEAPANVEPFEFVIQLEPGQSASVDVTVPWVPVADARADQVKAVADARFDDYLEHSSGFWRKHLNPEAVFEVPEQKVMEMQKASLMYDLMARDLQEDRKSVIQTVSDVQYNQFFSRDAAFIIHTYDMLGLPKIAEECIEHVLLKDETGQAHRPARDPSGRLGPGAVDLGRPLPDHRRPRLRGARLSGGARRTSRNSRRKPPRTRGGCGRPRVPTTTSASTATTPATVSGSCAA